MGDSRGAGTAVLSLEGLEKSFGGTRALTGVRLDVNAGEVHALVGENGSGKSTLIKILSGYHHADAGRATLLGRRMNLAVDRAPGGMGISFVHQDLGLVPGGTVLENLRVGRYTTGLGRRIRWRSERESASRLLARFDLAIDVDQPVARLSQSERAILAVARAAADVEAAEGHGLLVLDEPTAALPMHEVDLLFGAMRRVAEAGSAVLFVSHNLDEVLAIGDRVSVLRDGRLITTESAAGLDQRALITLVLGREPGQLYPEIESRHVDLLVEVRGLGGRVASDVTLALRSGEILGLTGLVGAGHDEIPYLLFGAWPRRSGSITVAGRDSGHPTPERSKAAGVALLPADRQSQSAVPRATVRENVTLPAVASYRTRRGIDRKRETSDVRRALTRFGVYPADPERPFYSLSGGNQQKALLARWLRLRPRVLLLHEPTQGVDIGAREGIFAALRDAAVEGASILYSSVEHEDLAHLCDRVLVFRRGRVVGELSGKGLSRDKLAEYCYGRVDED